MHTLLLVLLLACGSSGPAAPPSLELPGPYTGMALPTAGATVKSHDGADLVLSYPNSDSREALATWAGALNADGWKVSDPEAGPGFVRLVANRGKGSLEVFVVKRAAGVEIHLELDDPTE